MSSYGVGNLADDIAKSKSFKEIYAFQRNISRKQYSTDWYVFIVGTGIHVHNHLAPQLTLSLSQTNNDQVISHKIRQEN